MIANDAYVMIIGAMKCATTSLYDYLDAHPAICPAAAKEPEFFSENQSHGLSVARYRDLWSFNDEIHRDALEASTGYTKFPSEPNVARRIRDYGLWPYFIYVVRNPFDRIASHFNFMSDFDPDWDLALMDDHLIATSNYYLQLARFRAYFPDDRIHVVDFDDLAGQPETVLRAVYDFLGLFPYHFLETYDIRNPTRRARRVDKKRWLGFLPRARGAARRKPAVTLSARNRAAIHEALAPDMRRLQRDFGVDVSRWGF